jgi:predicted RNase H-like HicB family nuclease
MTKFTIVLEQNPNGWWTSRIVEEPGAISQGRTPRGACDNVLRALRDLQEDA